MEYVIREVDNGFVVRTEGEDAEGTYTTKELVFTDALQTLQFLQSELTKKDEKSA